MLYEYNSTDAFEKILSKLDPYKRRLVHKRVLKILHAPHLEKPLSGPEHGFLSERLENLRIVYRIEGDIVKFYLLEDRGHAYG